MNCSIFFLINFFLVFLLWVDKSMWVRKFGKENFLEIMWGLGMEDWIVFGYVIYMLFKENLVCMEWLV